MSNLWSCGRICLRYKVVELVVWRDMTWLVKYCESQWDSLPFQKYTVPLALIMPTQGQLYSRHVAHYLKRTRLVDSKNHLPYGVRLTGDLTIYLLDGHHRWGAAQIKKRSGLRMQIVDLDIHPTEPESISLKEFA